jgi:hypothetical protein
MKKKKSVLVTLIKVIMCFAAILIIAVGIYKALEKWRGAMRYGNQA